MAIKRFPSDADGRCDATVCDGLVYAVATDPHCAPDITAQTRNTLEDLDRIL